MRVEDLAAALYRPTEQVAADLATLPRAEQLALFRLLTDLSDQSRLADVRQALGEALYRTSVGPRGGPSADQVVAELGTRLDGSRVMSVTRFRDLLRGRRGGVYRKPEAA